MMPLPLPIEPRIDPLATMKWTIIDDQWVRLPFIREGKGDRPAIQTVTRTIDLTRKDGK